MWKRISIVFVVIFIVLWGLWWNYKSAGFNAGVCQTSVDAEDWIQVVDGVRCRRAAELGDVWSQALLTHAYHNGLGTESDFNQAVYWGRMAASNGDASNKMALFYVIAENIDYADEAYEEEAMDLLRASAELRHPNAMYILGSLYAGGMEEVDYAKASKWLRRASEQGVTRAQFELGFLYNFTEEVKDLSEAVKWYREAIKGESLDAKIYLAAMYERGDGVVRDETEAFRLYKLAAEEGLTQAKFEVGRAYSSGMGIDLNRKNSHKWYLRAAKGGNIHAQHIVSLNLSSTYIEEVEKNLVLAHMWANIAAANGVERAAETRSRLEEQMTSQQVADAQTKARDCLESSYENC